MADDSAPSTAVAAREAQHPVAVSGPGVPGMMSPDEIQAAYRVAAALAQSGIYKDVKSAEQAFAKLVVGRSLGLNEAQSLSLYAMEGKIEVPATMMAGWVRQRPGYDYEVQWHGEDAAAPTSCRVLIYAGDTLRGSSEFSLADAERAGLVKPKSAWDKFPRNMLFARALSNAVRWYVPEVLGGLPVYTEGEIERVPNLAEGSGDGAEPGWGSVPIAAVHEVEKLMRRAERLGHDGLTRKAPIQMMLSGQTDATIAQWIQEQSAELDALQAKRQVERGEQPEPEYATPEEAGTPQPEGVNDDGSPMDEATDVEDAPEPTEEQRAAAGRVAAAATAGDEEAISDAVDELADLPPQTQLALAEARLGAAQSDREEQEARAEVDRLRGEAT